MERQGATGGECHRTEQSNSFATASVKLTGSPQNLFCGEREKERQPFAAVNIFYNDTSEVKM